MWDGDDLDDDDHDVNEQAPKLVPHQGEGRRVLIMMELFCAKKFSRTPPH